jgi:hypothetical protein
VKTTAIVLTAALLTGCTAMPHVQVQGWPQDMKTTVHQSDLGEINSLCYSSLPLPIKLLGGFAMACTWVDLEKNTCDVYLLSENDPNEEHELMHCRGLDHDGILQAMYNNWKGGKK